MFAQAPRAVDGDVHLLPVQGNVSMLVGAGANITVQAGDDGILLVDTGVAELSEKVLDAIWPLSKKPLVYIINTSDQADHVGGNEKIGKAGRPVSTVGQVRMFYRNDWLRQSEGSQRSRRPVALRAGRVHHRVQHGARPDECAGRQGRSDA